MRHGNKQKKFGRVNKQRDALLQTLAISLIEHGKISTTSVKAKALRPYADKLITRGKKVTPAITRKLLALLGEKATEKLVKEYAPRFDSRAGGYTRITKLPARTSDGSSMAIIEFL